MKTDKRKQLVLSSSDRKEIAEELDAARVLMGNTFLDLKKLKLAEESSDKDRTNCLQSLRRRIRRSKKLSLALKNTDYFVVLT